MSTRQITTACRRNDFELFEVVPKDGEKWIVVRIEKEKFSSDTLYLEPLTDFIARCNYIEVQGNTMTIADYVNRLAEDYENRALTEKKKNAAPLKSRWIDYGPHLPLRCAHCGVYSGSHTRTPWRCPVCGAAMMRAEK